MLTKNIKSKFISLLLLILFFTNTGFCNKEIEEFFLPQNHPLHLQLDKIFVSKDILENKSSLKTAGFTILYNQPSGMQVAKHPLLSGYLIKTYFNSNDEHTGLQWAIDRCLGAKNIKNLIKERNLQYFTVPNKWIYLVSYPDPTIAVLLVEDMELVSKEQTKKAWKNATKKQIKELYTILSHGFGSCYLSGNAPYTKKGKFAYVDTAYPYRQYDSYERMKRYFSPEMQKYWDKIVLEGKK